MMTNFDDLCLWTYVTVDDIVIELAYSNAPGLVPLVANRYWLRNVRGGTLKPNCSLNLASTRICLYCRSKPIHRRRRNLSDRLIESGSDEHIEGAVNPYVLLIVCRFPYSFISCLHHQTILL